MKKLPLTIQLIVILFLVLVIPSTVLSAYSSYAIIQYSREEIAATALSGMEANRRGAENLLENVTKSVQRTVSTFDFNVLKDMEQYDNAIKVDPVGGVIVKKMQRELSGIVKIEPAIYSAFFYQDDADYVVSTDRGIVKLYDYASISWLRNLPKQTGVAGQWMPRVAPGATLREVSTGKNGTHSVNVISYVYNLNKMTTSIQGTLVVNVKADALVKSLNPDKIEDPAYMGMLLKKDGAVIAHPNSNEFLKKNSVPYFEELTSLGSKKGYAFYKVDGQERLYTYLQSEQSDWIYVSVQSMEVLNQRTGEVQRNMIIMMVVIILLGSILSVFIVSWFSKPMRTLVESLKSKGDLEELGERNELMFLNSAFEQVQQQEMELKNLLLAREQDAVKHALRRLLTGDYGQNDQLEVLEQIYVKDFFVVIVLAIDNYAEYRRKTNVEMRVYHRYLLIEECEKLADGENLIRGVRYADDQLAFLLNFASDRDAQVEAVLQKLTLKMQQVSSDITERTITIGVSPVGYKRNSVPLLAKQAVEALRSRIVKGPGAITFWSPYQNKRQKYIYPADSEHRILNYLDTGDTMSIGQELTNIQVFIQETPGVSYDNIRFIYSQLLGVTVKYLVEKGVTTVQLMSGRDNLYAVVAELETLDEITEYLNSFYADILAALYHENTAEKGHLNRVLTYLQQNYANDIYFDEMAESLGISYSYMRKLVKDATDKSMLDYLNNLRIAETKRLLLSTELSVAQIAEQVGYRNVQSLNRFFKKYEGINPSEYRAAHEHSVL